MTNTPSSTSRLSTYQAVSFTGCGALNFYQAGVAAGLQLDGLPQTMRFAGASAGAGLAFTMAAGLDAREVAATMAAWMTELGVGRALRPSWAHQIGERFGQHFVSQQTFDHARGRVAISVTQLRPLSNLCVQDFYSPQDLRDALTASCFLPYPGRPTVAFRGKPCLDGGFTKNQPQPVSSTLRVTPFWFQLRSHIRATFEVQPHQALKVPSEAQAWSLFDAGQRDYLRWSRSGSTSEVRKRARNVAQDLLQVATPRRLVPGLFQRGIFRQQPTHAATSELQ